MTWDNLGDWLQFVAAAVTIIAAPFVAHALKYIFRSRIVVKFRPANAQTRSWWNIQAKNKTGNIDSAKLVIYPHLKSARIKSARPLDNNAGVELRLEAQGQHLIVSSSFWPRDRDLMLRIEFDRPTVPLFKSPQFAVKDTYVFPDLESRFYPGALLITAQLRVLLLASYFALVAFVALVRLVFLGTVGEDGLNSNWWHHAYCSILYFACK